MTARRQAVSLQDCGGFGEFGENLNNGSTKIQYGGRLPSCKSKAIAISPRNLA